MDTGGGGGGGGVRVGFGGGGLGGCQWERETGEAGCYVLVEEVLGRDKLQVEGCVARGRRKKRQDWAEGLHAKLTGCHTQFVPALTQRSQGASSSVLPVHLVRRLLQRSH